MHFISPKFFEDSFHKSIFRDYAAVIINFNFQNVVMVSFAIRKVNLIAENLLITQLARKENVELQWKLIWKIFPKVQETN